jgi:hypothetical protein
VVIGEKRTIIVDEKILSREVVVEKTDDGKESMKITIKAPILGDGLEPRLQKSQQGCLSLHNRSDRLMLLVKLVQPGGPQHHRSDRSVVPVRPALRFLDGKILSSQRDRRRGSGR